MICSILSNSIPLFLNRPAFLGVLLVLVGAASGCRTLPAPLWQTTKVVAGPRFSSGPDAVPREQPSAQQTDRRPNRSTMAIELIAAGAEDSVDSDDAEIVRPKFPWVGHTRRPALRGVDDSTGAGSLFACPPVNPYQSADDALVDADDDHALFPHLAPQTGELLTAMGEEDPWGDSLCEDCPGDDRCRFTFCDDACGLLPMLGEDVESLFTWRNILILGAGAGGAVAIREHLDGDVRDYSARHRQLWGEGSQVLRQFGEFAWQVPVIAGVYAYSLWSQDELTHEFAKALISAYTITSVATVAIKGMTNTNRPSDQYQNGHYGFPSFHAASTFSIAAVIDDYYGWPAGLPAYALAGLVGWSRIDQREHDLSDVVFGALLGLVIGKSVAAAHLDRYTGCEVIPYFDSTNRALGVMFHKAF
ncbi:MAG: phosphatase PAP2 family protein [Planctomycetaceae bacterium]|nr:phosphatase PAP2 family protein [Planctomycetaceae bacterium]